jgi:rod shape-determining protein MreD
MTALQVEKRPSRGGFISELPFARVFAIGAVMIVAVAVQSALLVHATILGVIPQLVLVVIVGFAYTDGERVGIVTGFCGGLLVDLLLPSGSVVGLTALIYTLVGYGVAYFKQFFPGESVLLPVVAVALASAVAEMGYALMSIIMGQEWVSLGFTGKVAGLVVLYNTLLTPFAFPLIARVSSRFHRERVHRW